MKNPSELEWHDCKTSAMTLDADCRTWDLYCNDFRISLHKRVEGYSYSVYVSSEFLVGYLLGGPLEAENDDQAKKLVLSKVRRWLVGNMKKLQSLG
jgi:hypothetical protein